MEDRMEVLFGYSDVFGGSIPQEDFALLTKYSTKNILIKIAHINAILFTYQPDSDLRIFQEVLFGNTISHPIFSQSIKRKFGKGVFFASPSLSVLLKHAINHYQEDQDPQLSYGDFAIDLLKTILIFNETYNNNLKAANDLISFRSVFTLAALQQSYIRTTSIAIYFLRSAFMCSFLSRDSYLKTYVISFCRQYGMSDPWKISKFLLKLFADNTTGTAKFVVDKEAIPANLLNDWVINSVPLAKESSITLNFDIIPKPLFVANQSEVIVLDLAFFQYIVNQGFFYNIHKKSIANSDSKLKPYNNFQSYIGKEYFEKFLCKKILGKIFSHRQQLVISDERYQDFIVKSSSDNMLIVEAKMSETHPNVLENIDFNAYKRGIDENFLSNKRTNKKNKGAYQILKQLDQLADKETESEIQRIFKIKKAKNLNIYPVLLTSDTNYNLLGTNVYINEQIKDELEKLRPQFKSIKPITVLNINTLIEYFAFFQSDRFNLTGLINAYFKEIKRWTKSYSSNKDMYSYYMSSRSFEDYAKEKLRGKSIIEDFEIFIQSFKDDLSNIDFTDIT